ncbi:MAG TPA: hypothetical protein PKH40_02010 [Treponemataceae bacterium]|jgi:hypothetical protein|nr:MAG: hypothetical protein BWY39_00308 [Spirochaetes bacterium ADurb.Bin269]TAH55223.1 MAG: hypothetical protein EWM51_03525 [Treponema sp.]HOC28431.1 hypothetical protein [Treponemataceae bacterium]HPX47554.1 hypothetical protein [Treponemataceae bacterium]HQL32422.1 hypothetical protein [Treponemataceae bacterium]
MNRSIGVIVLQVAIALYLVVSGISGLINSTAGDLAPVMNYLNRLFDSSSVVTFAGIILSVTELIAGFFLLWELFTTDLRITDMILFIIIVLWIANIVLVDFIGPIGEGRTFGSVSSVLRYLGTLSSHLMVLGGLIVVTKKFH